MKLFKSKEALHEKKLFHLCVEGDVNKTYKHLKALDPKTDGQKHIENKYYQRFFKENPDFKISHSDPWIENIMNTYRSYFVDVLTNKVERSLADAYLLKDLKRLLTIDDRVSEMDTVEEKIKAILKEKGYSFF